MGTEKNDKSLHFIVRGEGYAQSIGYGQWLNHALQALNRTPPDDAESLLTQTANLLSMRSGGTNKRMETLDHCLPAYVREQWRDELYQNEISAFRVPRELKGSGQTDEVINEKYFGPAASPIFGRLCHELIEEGAPIYNAGRSQFMGTALTTNIRSADGAVQYRGYYDILAKNQELDAKTPSADKFPIQFEYEIPGTGQKLRLMTIDFAPKLEDRFINSFVTRTSEIRNALLEHFRQQFGNQPIFMHPNLNREQFGQLVACLNPLLQIIDQKPDFKPGRHEPPPMEKQDAFITAYWLVAQTTPVFRGGSGYANVIREHLAEKLRRQGYEYGQHYTKENVDLWAEAVTCDLEKFKKKFKSGQFFDVNVTKENMEDYLMEKVASNHKNGGAHFCASELERRKNPPTDYRWFGG